MPNQGLYDILSVFLWIEETYETVKCLYYFCGEFIEIEIDIFIIVESQAGQKKNIWQ